MRVKPLAAVAYVLFIAACGGAVRVASYGTVAAICTAEKDEIVEKAATPPTEEDEAAFAATMRVCRRILDRIKDGEDGGT